ncbi:MAG: hypothetical protein EKK41_01240 [Hyphomicrobiales bacterium]|nr:MAG: hypothetical protein EKK41_01240 [Hyphomicrobiales bacterium]
MYRGPQGEAQRFTGIAFDVTERKQAEARAGRLHEATAALSAAASAAEVAKLVLLHAPAAAGARAASLWLAGDEQPPPAMPAEAVGAAREALRDGPPVVAVDGGRLTLLALSAGEGPSGVL